MIKLEISSLKQADQQLRLTNELLFLKNSLLKHIKVTTPKDQKEIDHWNGILDRIDKTYESILNPPPTNLLPREVTSPACEYAMQQLVVAQIAVLLACGP
jgi:hypothetical protein